MSDVCPGPRASRSPGHPRTGSCDRFEPRSPASRVVDRATELPCQLDQKCADKRRKLHGSERWSQAWPGPGVRGLHWTSNFEGSLERGPDAWVSSSSGVLSLDIRFLGLEALRDRLGCGEPFRPTRAIRAPAAGPWLGGPDDCYWRISTIMDSGLSAHYTGKMTLSHSPCRRAAAPVGGTMSHHALRS